MKCLHCSKRDAIIYLDKIVWPEYIGREEQTPLCGECFVCLYINGAMMAARDTDGKLHVHIKSGEQCA